MCFHFQCFSKNMKENNNNNNTTGFYDPADEADDALSLCDLPLDDYDDDVADDNNAPTTNSNDNLEEIRSSQSAPRSSSMDPHDEQFFEFLSDHSSDMCPAEDIIFCGKLIPSIPQPPSSATPPPPPPLFQQTTKSSSSEEDKSPAALLHRRSESFSSLRSHGTRCNSTKNYQYLRISRSLDYQKLRRIGSSKTSSDLDIQRSASVKSAGKEDIKKAASSRPKWYLPMFGIVKFPPEMDMRDIKSRNFRRNSSVMFPPLDAEGNIPANRSTGKAASSSSSSSWRLIKALSCSDHASVAVTASLCVSHA